MPTDTNHLIEIYKVEAEKYNKTRDIQWKMNVAFWTVLIVGIYAKSSKEGLDIGGKCFQACIGASYVLLHFIFVVQIQGSLRRSITRLRNCADNILQEDESKVVTVHDIEVPIHRTQKEVWRDVGWHFFQIVITIVLAYIFIAIKKDGK